MISVPFPVNVSLQPRSVLNYPSLKFHRILPSTLRSHRPPAADSASNAKANPTRTISLNLAAGSRMNHHCLVLNLSMRFLES